MKKLLCFFSYLILFMNLHAQELPKFGEMVKSYDNLPGICKFSKYILEEGFVHTGNPLSSYCEEHSNDLNYAEQNKATYLTEEIKNLLLRYYKNVGYIENVYLYKSMYKFDIANNFEGKKCIYAGCFLYNVVYNKNLMSEQERAKDVIENAIIPIIQKAGNEIIQLGYEYIMIGMGYLAKYPSADSADGAAVYCIIPINYISYFNSLEITTNELIANSKIYIKDIGDLKMITL